MFKCHNNMAMSFVRYKNMKWIEGKRLTIEWKVEQSQHKFTEYLKRGSWQQKLIFTAKILHLGPGLGYVTRHKSFCIGMFTMFSCSFQYNSNVFYVLPLIWQKESLNVFVLYIPWEAWRKSDQGNFGLFARADGEKKTSYFLAYSKAWKSCLENCGQRRKTDFFVPHQTPT